jgi:hypothetical protein
MLLPGAERALFKGGAAVDLVTLELAGAGGMSDEKLPVIVLLTLLRKFARRAVADIISGGFIA